MTKLLHAESTLTDRYQTTIPEPVRDLLHLNKRDKIAYNIQNNGTVLISRAQEEDPVLNQFLSFLAHDIAHHPEHVHAIDPALLKRAQQLVSGVDVDLDAALDDKDD